MDNVGENLYIEQAMRSDPVLCEMGTVVEYTAPYTPQQNGKVEQAFPTLFSRACALCNRAKLPTTLQRNYFVRPSKMRSNAFFQKNAPYVEDLHPWGNRNLLYSKSGI